MKVFRGIFIVAITSNMGFINIKIMIASRNFLLILSHPKSILTDKFSFYKIFTLHFNVKSLLTSNFTWGYNKYERGAL